MPCSHRKEHWRDPATASLMVAYGARVVMGGQHPHGGRMSKSSMCWDRQSGGHCSEGLSQLHTPQQFTA